MTIDGKRCSGHLDEQAEDLTQLKELLNSRLKTLEGDVENDGREGSGSARPEKR